MKTEKNNSSFGNEDMESSIWEYIDGRCNQNKKEVIDQLLNSDIQWKEKYDELIEIHRLVQLTGLEEPSMRFTKNVMEQIAMLHIAPATKNYINNKIIWGIAGFFIVLIISFLVYGLGQLDWSASGEGKFSIELDKVDYSKLFSNTYINIFMMINVVVGLFLLDRFLSIKKNRFRKEVN